VRKRGRGRESFAISAASLSDPVDPTGGQALGNPGVGGWHAKDPVMRVFVKVRHWGKFRLRVETAFRVRVTTQNLRM
jgi:hypothetical protein